MTTSRAPGRVAPTLLVVDDDLSLQQAVRTIFEAEGYRVLGATTAEEGLRLLSRGLRPDVVLLDIQMPQMSGWELLDQLRTEDSFSGIPVLLFSASVPATLPKRVSGALPKPLSVPRLLAAVKELCGR